MAAIPIILVGYEKTRHLTGIKELSQLGIQKIYLIRDTINPRFKEIAKYNAEELKEALSIFYETEILGCNPSNIESVFETLSYIWYKEKHKNCDLLVDISNTSKEFMMASMLFNVLFGVRSYYLVPKERHSIEERIEKVFSEIIRDSHVRRKLEEFTIGEGKKDVKKLLEFIKKEYIKRTLLQYQQKGALGVILLPVTVNIHADLRKEDYLILSYLAKIKREVKNVNSLLQEIVSDAHLEPSALYKLRYRLKKIEEWGFVTRRRDGNIQVELTSFGMGFIRGVERARGNKFLFIL